VLLNTIPGPEPVAMSFDFTPDNLNLNGHGLWVTGYLEPEPPSAAANIDVASIRLNGTVPVDAGAPATIGDANDNGIPDLTVKFNRIAVELILPEGDNVPVTVTGTLACGPFSATDHVRVRHVAVIAPLAGARLTAGSVTQVRWETPGGIVEQSVAVLLSLDGGATWDLIAQGRPNTGSHDWTVPSIPTASAKVAVVLVESTDPSGSIVDGVVGVSGAFAIETVVGVGERPSRLALAVLGGNPTQGSRLRVEFSLRDDGPARLEVSDVTGRVVHARDVGSLGPGVHALEVAQGSPLPAGIYFLRLTQGTNEARTRAAVVR
jgi:hypothetical protein